MEKIEKIFVSMPLRALFVLGDRNAGGWSGGGERKGFNALAGIICFGGGNLYDMPSDAPTDVSMPLRALFVLGAGVVEAAIARGAEFQCPCGHYLFWGSPWLLAHSPAILRFNALAGIICFGGG